MLANQLSETAKADLVSQLASLAIPTEKTQCYQPISHLRQDRQLHDEARAI